MGVVDGAVSQGIGVAAGMPFLGSLISGSEAAAQITRKIILQGGTNEQALWSGAAVGTVDLLLDSIPVERLLRMRDVNGIGDILYNAAKQAGLNAGTNTIAELSHITADALIMKDSSQFALRTEEYRRNGMSKSDAQRKALLDTVSDVLQAGATGALSGFVMGMAVDGTRYAAANRQSGQQGYDRLDLLGQALEMPEDSESRQIAQELTEELETALTERGLDTSDGYHLSRAEQQAMIGETVEAVLTDDAVSKLTDAVQAEHLTASGNRGNVDTQEHLMTEVYPHALADGHISAETIREYAKVLEDADIDSMSQYLQQMGYDTNATGSVREGSAARIIRITGNTKSHNVTQVQFSPGGRRHGANPYLKFSTTDQGIIKIVFGDPSTYVSAGNEKATIIFAQEVE